MTTYTRGMDFLLSEFGQCPLIHQTKCFHRLELFEAKIRDFLFIVQRFVGTGTVNWQSLISQTFRDRANYCACPHYVPYILVSCICRYRSCLEATNFTSKRWWFQPARFTNPHCKCGELYILRTFILVVLDFRCYCCCVFRKLLAGGVTSSSFRSAILEVFSLGFHKVFVDLD